MRSIGVVVAIVAVVGVVAIGFVAWNVYGTWPVPAGYAFPRHSLWGSGPAGLYEGRLVVDDGCILTEDGDTVIWPPFSSLAITDGQPIVRIGLDSVQIGDPVRLGGGYYEAGLLPEVARGADRWGCPGTYFLTTGPAS